MAKNPQPVQTKAPVKAGSKLAFAPSTFGQKKATPITQERVNAIYELHTKMCSRDANGNELLPAKTKFIVACSDAGFSAAEIAAALDMKQQIVYSMIWRIKSGYKPKHKKAVAEGAAVEAEVTAAEGDEDLPEEDEDELTDEELAAEL